MTTLLVSNAAAGGADDDVLAKVRECFEGRGVVHMLAPSEHDDGDAVLRERAGDVELVVVAGGDGSLNAAVAALGDILEEVVVGLVPMGTGNDFARTLGLPSDPIVAARAVATGEQRLVDVGRARSDDGEWLFANACMGGFPVAVNRAIDEDLKRRIGPLSFWWGGAKAAANLIRYSVRVDDRKMEDVVAVGVGNGRSAGGGIEVFPEARVDDGLLECCVIEASSVVEGLRVASRVRKGGHEGMGSVTTLRARSFRIEADPTMEFNVDGDVVDLRTPATFEVARRMRMMLPSSPTM